MSIFSVENDGYVTFEDFSSAETSDQSLAAHWRYKGVKGESGLDEWLTSIRETLENADSDLEVMDQFKLELYEDEVFVFTPYRLLVQKGACLLQQAGPIRLRND